MFGKRKDEEPAVAADAEQPNNGAQAALRDELGLHHLWYLELRLVEELARAARINSLFSVATWQLRLLPGEALDGEVLRKAAALIAESLRTYDLAAFVEPNRFIGLLLDAPYEGASTVAFRITGELQVRVPSAGRWQAGIAAFPQDGVDGDALTRTAFRRLDESQAA